MRDIIEAYGQVFEEVKAAGGPVALPLWRTEVSVRPEIVNCTQTLLDRIARFEGEGWLECTDAVRWRRGRDGNDWEAPLTKAAGPLDQARPPLAGEIVGEIEGHPASLQLRHLDGERWYTMVVMESGASVIAFDEALQCVFSRGSGSRPMLQYRTYWNEAAARADAVRFIGFERAEGQGNG